MKNENAMVLVPQGLANEIMRYLGARPYQEVAPIIQALQRCQVAEVKVEPPVAATEIPTSYDNEGADHECG